MLTTAEIAARVAGDRLPLLTLDEFFDGNVAEDSLAPNRWGFGRPTLAEIADRLRTLGERDDIAWIRIGLHDDTELDEATGDVIAESVLLSTTLPAAELEEMLDVEWLHSDGIVESDESSMEDYTDIPPVIGHHRVVFLVWD
ncbi:hypothetical protein [Microbacterium sp. ZW T5_56]|uniref:hypothetical protein n=1 Tax=Microbacterium sp. ZW T5_56 TaxID=3378081 RepID=UPI00385556CC